MWGRQKRRPHYFRRFLWFILILGGVFLFRAQILEYISGNPNTAKYVPSFITTALQRDLADWKAEDLQARYADLSSEVKNWQQKLTTAADEGQAKFEEVQANLNQAREALDETKAALDKLSEAGEGLKGVVVPSGE